MPSVLAAAELSVFVAVVPDAEFVLAVLPKAVRVAPECAADGGEEAGVECCSEGGIGGS